MQNVTMEQKNGTLTITIDLKAAGAPSKTGKTLVIASTHGNVTVPGDSGVIVGLNAYKRK